ncbi:hypothetical protein [Pectobacterium aroidearum]|uniref:hypothetical protein n=1 Tax=Pectobacterium aroidearum TaxID=1201031 RepID=UPI002113B0CA|nr:hypothetical protein [Pectobacterium aroidearum]UUE56877.1 hypothetical protein L0Y27_17090 [Pectobacterium aroidearum]UUE69583.1 hypothetical protein L0Y21_17980 [Pectobacterium aroidearum]UUE73955.1 hypothetical protein L0Y20_18085 [Pectobacterium aroidearum]UUE78290.1 hypothetical protein L0Y24_17525 [Pectobacterium aroidearum]
MLIFSPKARGIVLLGGLSQLFSSGVYAENYVDAGNVSVSWGLEELYGASPQTARLTNLTFRFNVYESTLHHDGTYFAQQFYFDNSESGENTGYLGLQPRQSKDGKNYLRAVFSSFISGTKTSDGNCSDGADGGDGVSCGIEFPAVYGHPYEITVFKVGNDTWKGEVQDMVTSEIIHIGSWSLPHHIGDLKPSGEGFAEYYDFYQPGFPQFVVPNCSQLAKINVLYGPVTTTDFGGGIGSVTNAYEYNSDECLNKASGFSSQSKKISIAMPNGKTLSAYGNVVTRGFVSGAGD